MVRDWVGGQAMILEKGNQHKLCAKLWLVLGFVNT